MPQPQQFDVIVIGGGPAGATAAHDAARAGLSVAMLDRDGRTKPCGGAIPPRLIEEFAIPESLLVARINGARMIAPSRKTVDIPINGGYVGMVDRDVFDEFLRKRAVIAGATRLFGNFQSYNRDNYGRTRITYHPNEAPEETITLTAQNVIAADGANSAVAKQAMPSQEKAPFVFAYHEIIRAPDRFNLDAAIDYQARRCDVIYDGALSPDFYSWVFPHGDTASIGTGTAIKGFSMRGAVATLRERLGLDHVETIRREGAPLPLRPLKRWDNGTDVILAGDAAGLVAPASGEGIYYAMTGGRLAAEAVTAAILENDARELKNARRRFMKTHGQVFWILGIMQKFWYSNDPRRERFVAICRDHDVQELTFDAYMNKALVRAKPLAHARIFFKNIAHLAGLPAA